MEVYEGAEHNLPDQAAMTTAERIQTMVSEKMCTDDILLVLISGKILYTEKKSESSSHSSLVYAGGLYQPNIGPGFSE